MHRRVSIHVRPFSSFCFVNCLCIVSLVSILVHGVSGAENAELRQLRGVRDWSLSNRVPLRAFAVAENDDVVLLQCNRPYSDFSGRILLRVSQLSEEDQQVVKRLHASRSVSDGVLPGDTDDVAGVNLESAISLSQITLGLLSYLNEHEGRFPPRTIESDGGRPLLSWRVRMLPYLGEQRLYSQFDLSEPWDSDKNRKLIKDIPLVYSAGTDQSESGKTRFLAPVGKGTLWEAGRSIELRQIWDGTLRTIAIVEVSNECAVEWTRPIDWQLDQKNMGDARRQSDSNGLHVGFADGHAASIPRQMEEATLKAYFTAQGREQVPTLGSPLPRRPSRPH